MRTEMKFNEKVVMFNGAQEKWASEWTYDGIEKGKIETLNKVLHDEIQTQVEDFIANREKREEEARIRAEQERYEKAMEKFLNWKELATKAIGDMEDVDLVVKFKEPRKTDYRYTEQVCFNDVSVYFDDKVTSDIRFGGYHKTNKPWVVMHNYKNVRYGTLEKAIEKAKEKANQDLLAKKRQAEKESSIALAERKMKEFAEQNGFKFEVETKSNHTNVASIYQNRRYYKVYFMSKKNIVASIQYNAETKAVEITSYTVRKGNITVEELNQAAE